MDFDPEGTKIITVDDNGTCLISEVDTENALFSLKLPQGGKGNFEMKKVQRYIP